MRILMLAPHPTAGGPLPKLTPLLVAALGDQGCEVTVQPWGRRHDGERWWRKLVERCADVWRARRTLRRQPVDLLVVATSHDWATLSRDIPLLLATRSGCRKAVLQFHGSRCDRLVAPGHLAFKLASRVLLALSDAALVLSTEEQGLWQRFSPHGRFYPVRNPVAPVAALEASTARAQIVPAIADPVVLFVGRLINGKGIDELLAVVPQVLTQAPFHLLVVGEGPLESALRHSAAAAGIADQVTFAGYVQGETLHAAYARATVFVLPTSLSEGFPLVILEAMAAGLPIITTRLRGMADHLREGVNALFVPTHDGAALAAALTRLLHDPQLRTRMEQANREKVREFSPDAVGREYLGVLRNIVAGPASVPAGQ